VSSMTCGHDPWHTGRWDFMTLRNVAKIRRAGRMIFSRWRRENGFANIL